MKIGLFGGTFDPIHFGHLNLAIQMLEGYGLDQILFCPTSSSPLKENKPQASKRDRAEMVRLAIAPIPQFKLFDHELDQDGPSYTIDTVRYLIAEAKRKHEKKTFYLILGEDSLITLAKWKDVEELLALVHPLVGMRLSDQPADFLLNKPKIETVKIPLIEISSTDIRQRLHQKKYCGHLIPSEVLAYIQHNQLYSN
jgi:nicotinate-nucleotide adenylyltransferase